MHWLGPVDFEWLRRNLSEDHVGNDKTFTIGFALTQMLRHLKTYTRKEKIVLEPDGHVQINLLEDFRLMRCLGADASTIRDVIAAENSRKSGQKGSGKQRIQNLSLIHI